MKLRIPSLFLSLIIIIVGSSVLWLGTDGFNSFTTETARRLSVIKTPRDFPEILVEDQAGKIRELTIDNNKMIIIDFIYTSCPTVCRTLGTQFKKLQSEIIKNNLSDKVSLFSISFDIKRDNYQTLNTYLQRYNANNIIWKGFKLADEASRDAIFKQFDITVVPDEYNGFTHNSGLYTIINNKLVSIYDYQDINSIVDRIWRYRTKT